jgi:3-oxoacyl-[acyl-carrier protein] reductase
LPNVFITGASRGIGAAIARRLIGQGTTLAILVRSENDTTAALANACTAAGATFVCLRADITDRARVEKLVAELNAAHPIDVLVNNAGIVHDGLALRLDHDDYAEVMATNFFAAVDLAKLFLKGMVKRRFGRIIYISSLVADRGNPGQSAYAAAKAALNGYTRSVGKEMASRGVTVNAVAPGFVMSDMTERLSSEWKEKIIREIPLRRMGQPAEVAEVVAFLASEEAGYVTGQIVEVGGGI